MLRPTKHSNPDKTIINVSLIVVKRLKELRIEKYSDLLCHTKKAVSGGDFLFLPALNFLFLVGLIEYHPKTDVIEYVAAKNEAV
jgi:hypothetical protein